MTTTDISDQVERGTQDRGSGYCTKPRHADLGKRTTRFVSAQPISANLVTSADRVYMVGKPPAARQLVTELGTTARLFLDSHYPIVQVQRSRLTWAGAWWGDEADAATCERWWRWLDAAIVRHWKRGGLLLTPATTGRDLWLRTLPAAGYPVLRDETQRLIRQHAGQGRIEVCAGANGARADAGDRLYLYDARLAYLASTRELPVGEPVHLYGAEAAAMADSDPRLPARWAVTWKAPRGWHTRPGILPAKDDDGGWTWPLESPADRVTWVDGCELACARKWGWTVRVHEGIVFPGRADVFRTWQDRLLAIIDEARRELPAADARGIRAACRAMALHTIGALHGAPHKATGIGTEPPEHAYGIQILAGGLLTWTTDEAPAWPQLCHPEWTAAIWARARVRLLDHPTPGVGALHLPPHEVVGFRTDAILTRHATDWDEAERVGTYRLQGSLPMIGRQWPTTNAELLALKRQLDGAAS